jgi:hypothetical protein
MENLRPQSLKKSVTVTFKYGVLLLNSMYEKKLAFQRLNISENYQKNIHILNIPVSKEICAGWAWKNYALILTSGNLPKTDRMVLHEYYHIIDTNDYGLMNKREKSSKREANAEFFALEGLLELSFNHPDLGHLEYFDYEITRIDNATKGNASSFASKFSGSFHWKYLDLSKLKSLRSQYN